MWRTDMKENLACQEGTTGAELGVGKHRKEGYIPKGQRDLRRHCLVPHGRGLG